jgi:hypothetical protein
MAGYMGLRLFLAMSMCTGVILSYVAQQCNPYNVLCVLNYCYFTGV